MAHAVPADHWNLATIQAAGPRMLRIAEDRDHELRALPKERLPPLRYAEQRAKIIGAARATIDGVRAMAVRAGEPRPNASKRGPLAGPIDRALQDMERDWQRSIRVQG